MGLTWHPERGNVRLNGLKSSLTSVPTSGTNRGVNGDPHCACRSRKVTVRRGGVARLQSEHDIGHSLNCKTTGLVTARQVVEPWGLMYQHRLWSRRWLDSFILTRCLS